MADFSTLKTRIDNEINDLAPGAITEAVVRTLLKDGMIDGFNAAKADPYLVASSIPAGGILPDKLYFLGTISANTSIPFATAPSDGYKHTYTLLFSVSGTPTITLPASITKWLFDLAPSFADGKTYLISVENGFGVFHEYGSSPTPPPPTPGSIELSPSTMTFAYNAAIGQVLSIVTESDWEISTDASWITFSQQSGSGNANMFVNCQNNLTPTSRSASVRIQDTNDPSVYAILSVTQEASAVKTLSISPTSLTFPANGSPQVVQVTSNDSWQTINGDWYTITPVSGTGDKEVVVSVNINTGPFRQATIPFLGSGGEQATLVISQNAS